MSLRCNVIASPSISYLSKMEARKRRPNFSQAELEILAKEVSENKNVLFSKFLDTVTNEKKKIAWHAIRIKVNSVSSTERTTNEVRKKWSDWSSLVKIKGAKLKNNMKKTGGGSLEAPLLSPLEELVIDTIGVTAVEGINGGRDSVPSLHKGR